MSFYGSCLLVFEGALLGQSSLKDLWLWRTFAFVLSQGKNPHKWTAKLPPKPWRLDFFSSCLDDWAFNLKEISFKIVKNSQDYFLESLMTLPSSHIRLLFTRYPLCLIVYFFLCVANVFIPSHNPIPIRFHPHDSQTLPLHIRTLFLQHWLGFHLLITIMHMLRFLIVINS